MDECFVIMPISTPAHLVDTYGGDPDHFLDVYEYLFKPAIGKAELTPVPPAAKGSELIQGEIIKRIEEANLVLCDMSVLNPNVFFELGIRTALNKPVCLVKDNETPKVPFDTGIINHHTYRCKLTAKELKTEIPNLAGHIKESMETSDGGNSMWKYFGLSTAARPAEVPEGADAKLDYLIKLTEGMRADAPERVLLGDQFIPMPEQLDVIFDILGSLAKQDGVEIKAMRLPTSSKVIEINRWDGVLSPRTMGQMQRAVRETGRRLVFDEKD